MILLVAILTVALMASWWLLICLITFKSHLSIIPKPNGTYFCHQCSYVIGHRMNGREIINGLFVERSEKLDLPSNVIPFRKTPELGD